MLHRSLLCASLAVLVGSGTSFSASLTEGMKKGTPELKSVGPIAFGPEGILFISDPVEATIVAVATDDTKLSGKGEIKIEKIDDRIAGVLGSTASDIALVDMKVNPASGNVYFSVTRGKGSKSTPLIVKLDRAGKLIPVELKDVAYSSVKLPNPATGGKGGRADVITSLAFVKDQVIVAGLSNEEFASKLRSIHFPFKDADRGSSVEIFHGAHGKLETRSPVRTFTTLDINGETNVLAAYTCTPLVRIPLGDLKPGEKVKGTTVAELGNRNSPLDMFVYKKDGKDFILMANNKRGVMKVAVEGVDKVTPITAPVKTEKAGLTYETISDLKDVVHLDKLDDGHALLLVKSGDNYNLSTITLP